MRNLNSHPAYKKMRIYRAYLKSHGKPVEGLNLVPYLVSYSEKKGNYTKASEIKYGTLAKLEKQVSEEEKNYLQFHLVLCLLLRSFPSTSCTLAWAV